MTFSPLQLANNFVRRAIDEQVDMPVMKLQRLIYFTAAEYAKNGDGPLLHETFLAWPYGPVVRTVQDKFAVLGGKPIRVYSRDAAGKARTINEEAHPDVREAIDKVWRHGKNISAARLAQLSQMPGSPWRDAYVARRPVISDFTLVDDFTYRDRLGIQ